jgi:hypothetical protein
LIRVVALVAGLGLTLAGLLGVGAYVVGAVDIVLERPPDRSWLFWGLGLAGVGASMLVAGVALLVLWRHLGKKDEGPARRTDVTRGRRREWPKAGP